MVTGWVGGFCLSRRFSLIYVFRSDYFSSDARFPLLCVRVHVYVFLHNNFSLRMDMQILKAVEGFRRGELRAPVSSSLNLASSRDMPGFLLRFSLLSTRGFIKHPATVPTWNSTSCCSHFSCPGVGCIVGVRVVQRYGQGKGIQCPSQVR